MTRGKVFIVGAGPGDPGLLTLNAQKALAHADVVLYDALIDSRILELIPETARKIFRGKRSKKGALSQAHINAWLVRWAKQGKKVVRLKGGDPFVFGRGAEEALELKRRGIDFEIVPGISSAIAVPAYAGIPVTHRAMNSSFTVVTGHEDPTKPEALIEWKSLALNEGTLVFLMGLHTLRGVCARLIQEGKKGNTPAAVIQSGTTLRQKTVAGTLETIAALTEKFHLKAPATVVVGKVVALRKKLQWLKPGSLSGFKILLTRTRAQASFLSDQLAEKGAEVREIPTVEIAPLPLSRTAEKWLREIGNYDWIILTSSNAVEILMANLFKLKKDARQLANVKLACVGSATAKSLKSFGLQADLIPEDYKQEGLIQSLRHKPLHGKKILFARAKEGRDILLKFLKAKGALVDFWPLYENRIPPGTGDKIRRLFAEEGGVDLLTFASSSSADHFYGLFSPVQRKKWLRSLPAAVIGPVTAASVKKWGGKVVLQPRSYTMPALVAAIEKWVKKHRHKS